jgi:uncharacterized protein involved in exopolysaccharide biosynthesis
MAQNDDVKLHFLDYWRVIRVHWVLVLLAFFLVLITPAIVSYFSPREYQSSSFIEVKSTASTPRIFGNCDPTCRFTIATGKPFSGDSAHHSLYPVIEQLKLQDKWARDGVRPTREQAYAMLRSKLDVDEVRNTDLLQISVFDTNPQMAADIANKIVAVYQDKRVEEEKEMLNRAVTTMNEKVSKQQKSVDDAATDMSRIRDEEHIIDLNPEGTEDTQAPINNLVVKQETTLNESETKVATLQSQLEQIEKMKGPDLMRMLATLNIQDPTVQKVLPNYQEAVAQEALLLNSGFGPNHPKVKAIHATQEVYAQQLEEQVSSIRVALEKMKKTAQATL